MIDCGQLRNSSWILDCGLVVHCNMLTSVADRWHAFAGVVCLSKLELLGMGPKRAISGHVSDKGPLGLGACTSKGWGLCVMHLCMSSAQAVARTRSVLVTVRHCYYYYYESAL